MKKFIKGLLIILLIAGAGLLINENPHATGVIVIVTGITVLLILFLGKGKGGRYKGGYANSQYAQHQSNQEWLKLYHLTEIYSGWQSLRHGLKINYTIRLDGYVYTIDACLDMEDCDPDTSRYDMEASARYATEQLQQKILADASAITNEQITVRIGNID